MTLIQTVVAIFAAALADVIVAGLVGGGFSGCGCCGRGCGNCGGWGGGGCGWGVELGFGFIFGITLAALFFI